MKRAGAASFHDRKPWKVARFHADLSSLPQDVIVKIFGSFWWPDLMAASLVCRSWCNALTSLRDAMVYVRWGKNLKHGRNGVTRNLNKSLDSFLKGACRGSTAAMVDAGLLLWESGKREEGIKWYRQAAEMGDPAGQCNLGLAYLQDSSRLVEAVKWLQEAANAGHVRAQYTLALCLQHGTGVDRSPFKAAQWYLKAAKGGNPRAMHNIALCYSEGEGITQNLEEARRWMRRAAFAGNCKAQFDYGVSLFLEGSKRRSLLFLELATRAGETAATHLRDTLWVDVSATSRARVMYQADKWQGKQSRYDLRH